MARISGNLHFVSVIAFTRNVAAIAAIAAMQLWRRRANEWPWRQPTINWCCHKLALAAAAVKTASLFSFKCAFAPLSARRCWRVRAHGDRGCGWARNWHAHAPPVVAQLQELCKQQPWTQSTEYLIMFRAIWQQHCHSPKRALLL